MNVLLVGDTHCYMPAIHAAIRDAKNANCRLILQIGDFGYFPGMDKGQGFLRGTERFLADAGLELWWLDGNHEDHTALGELTQGRYDQPRQVSPHIHYLPRSCTFSLAGIRFMALGGAYSIDKDLRTPYVDWWPEETISAGDAERAISRGHVDVVLSHDTVIEANPLVGKDLYPDSQGNRRVLSAVVDAIQPRLLVHGHYHRRYTQQLDSMRVEGLDCNGKPGSSLVLDLADFRASNDSQPMQHSDKAPEDQPCN